VSISEIATSTTPESDEEFALDSVFVGSESYSTSDSSTIVVWGWRPGGGSGGGGSGWGGGYDTSEDYGDSDESPAAEEVPVTGRNCPAEQAAAQQALDLLYQNSPTARSLIESAKSNNVGIHIIQINPALAHGQQLNQFDYGNGIIYWDPFVYITGFNTDGSTYTLTPIMLLAHELVHAGYRFDPAWQGHDSEWQVIPLANVIAQEMSAATGKTITQAEIITKATVNIILVPSRRRTSRSPVLRVTREVRRFR
jgi:hypothetical protein